MTSHFMNLHPLMTDLQLIWFRQDLRIHDHSALWHAQQAGPCIVIVVLSPAQWQRHDDATIKIDFYLRQLKSLKQQLQTLNIPLIIEQADLWDDIPEKILHWLNTLQIQTVHANIEYGLNENQRDRRVIQHLANAQKSLKLYHDRCIFNVGTLLNKNQQPYKVFGAFKKSAYEQLHISLPQCFPPPEVQTPIDITTQLPTHIASTTELGLVATPCEQQELWPVTEAYAWTKLDDFIQNDVQHYDQTRDFPNLQQTSMLSPYLNIGILSIRQCLQALFRPHYGLFEITQRGQQIWLDELLWREFYQHILFHFPHLSKGHSFKTELQHLSWRDAKQDLYAWQHGLTGIPIVDAGMRQLLHTGWMHNRVRMICAMFLSKNLLIDWRLGEQWFMQHLIDGDLAANNGGWQWCASTGVDAVPYFRIFNPVTQSERFDPNGDYIRQWLPELAHLNAKVIHAPYTFQKDIQLDYPKPIVDLKQSRLRAIEHFKQHSS